MAIAEPAPQLSETRTAAERLLARRRNIALAVPVLLVAYLAYIVLAFDLPGLLDRARLDNAKVLVADAYSYKYHVTRDRRTGIDTVSIEGQTRATFADDAWPQWVRREGASIIVDLDGGHHVRFDPDAVRHTIPDYGEVVIRQDGQGLDLETPDGSVPAWINASSSRITVVTGAGRLTVTRNRTEVFRYVAGWELFFFTLDSPFYGKSPSELVSLILSDEEARPGRSNLSAMLSDFWNNAHWRHSDVAWAIFETILMAFLGTVGAALFALPLAFLAARNFTPGLVARFGCRRLFDFLRGVDGLVWTIILSRAFGPGPLTGSLAILITDTGSLGKLFSEALENVDGRQIEGVRSTGANALQRNRFGVIPQVAPVILSQILYFLESNTRSATVIGAIVGGGIGLLLTQAIQTQNDWEKVTYYILLTLVMVSLMDILSGWLRQRLIGRTTHGPKA
jgi:phosphonate transport system permease protein